MEEIKKQQMVNTLRLYCERYESQNKAARSLKGVSAGTISQMLNGNWELIKDEMWRNVAAQTGYKDERWAAVETGDYKRMMALLQDVQANNLVMGITGDAGAGKTFACKQYTQSNKQVYMLCCNEYWNRKLFLTELLTAMGRDYTGYTVGEMMQEAVRTLKMQESPLLILDEADKLNDQVLYFFITLYNNLEDECGILLCATSHLEKRIQRGVKLNKKGYSEIWSRLGRKCIRLKGVTAADVVAICEANGITERTEINSVLDDCESDLRRVKRRVHALTCKHNQ
ncbi:MAG: ATP-binding protein [Paludibacter sp.]|nr:ATP-binding protein [Bacteroidales bacterium]MCM1069849.1 ATP-binding protein [Prevotella sp.]MCM1353958.1 ATP-binding protein [Bacteroides sp.]MCM1443400.1 ATP-binding protein [Muribaculum sp.]MCM1482103.1 ATP-binding protein [Paludibacter sp.]